MNELPRLIVLGLIGSGVPCLLAVVLGRLIGRAAG